MSSGIAISREERRALARLLLEHGSAILLDPTRNLAGPFAEFLDDLVLHCADGPTARYRLGEPPINTHLSRFLAAFTHLHELICFIFRHDFLSSEANPEAFREWWFLARGFDIDGLLIVGENSGRLISPSVPRLALREKYERYDATQRDSSTAGADHHVHFGQMIDPQVLWLANLASKLKYPLNGMGALKSGHAPVSAQFERARLGQWQQRVNAGRLLLVEFDRHKKGRISDAELRTSSILSKQLVIGCVGADIIDDDAAIYTAKYFGDCEDAQQAELELYAAIRNCDPSIVRMDAALSYLIIKSGFFDSIGQNNVATFEQFSRRLKDLDLIYRSMEDTLSRTWVSDYLKSFVRMSGSAGQGVKVRIGGKGIDGARLRDVIRKIKGLDRPVVLAIKRDDFESIGSRDESEFRSMVPRVIEGFRSEGIDTVGVDLIGPEVRDFGADFQAEGTTVEFSRNTVHFAFELRELVAACTNGNPYVVFHAGEHCPDARVALLTLMVIVSDSRFRIDSDRIAHALILWESRDVMRVRGGRKLEDAIQLLLSAVRSNIRSGDAYTKLNIRGMTPEEVVALSEMVAEADLGASALTDMQEMLRNIIIKNGILVEVCPASNFMIRRDLLKFWGEHPWATAGHGQRTLLGTDDPSLTQSMPWIEQILLGV